MAAPATQQPVSAQVVANAFVQQYYHILHQSPAHVHRFYQDISTLGRPEDDGSLSTTTTMDEINHKILSLNYDKFRAEIKSVDAQESLSGGFSVLVTGYMIGEDNILRNFTQSFFLAPQEKGFFVLNDMFRYIENTNHREGNSASVDVVVTPVPPDQEIDPVQENHIFEVAAELADEVRGEEAYNPPEENGEVSVVEEEVPEEEVPVAEVVDEEPDASQQVVESGIKIEEVRKKSYASIVMDLKENKVPFSSPAPPPRRPQPRSQDQQEHTTSVPASVVDAVVSSLDAVEISNEVGEADGYSIYIKGLPMNATPALLAEEFKKFGPIKNDGIQVRSNKGFCFGFVEFEVPEAVQKAIEASPITINGRQAFAEEKRSTYSSRGNRGRLPAGRGPGYRSEGSRGRNNYGGGRGYGHYSYNRNNEYGNRFHGRGSGGGFNRGGGEGYQRDDYNGGGGRANRSMAQHVPATA